MKTKKTGYEDMSTDQLFKLVDEGAARHNIILAKIDAVKAELKRRKEQA